MVKMVEKWKIPYLAGIIDGEGCILITLEKGKKKGYSRTYRLRITVENTDKKLMEWLKENFNGSFRLVAKATNHNKTRYAWTLNSKDSYPLLKEIKPYLIIKPEQANIGIKFQELTIKYAHMYQGRGKKTPEWINIKREVFRQELNNLHL